MTRLVELYEKSKCDDGHELESIENMSIMSSCSEEASQDLKSAEPEKEVQVEVTALSASTYRTCLVSLPNVSGMAEAARQQAVCDDEAQARWRPSDESTSVSHDTHHLCLMAKKSKKKASKRDQAKEIAQVDDQGCSCLQLQHHSYLDHPLVLSPSLDLSCYSSSCFSWP